MFEEGRLVRVSATWLEHVLDRLVIVIIVLLIFSTFLGPSSVSQPSPTSRLLASFTYEGRL